MKSFFLCTISLILVGCASKSPNFNQKRIGHENLYSLPSFDSYSTGSSEYKLDLIYIKDLSTNNQLELAYPDRKELLKVSGKNTLYKYLSIAKKKLGKDLLIFNGGNFLNNSISTNKNNVRMLNKVEPVANLLSFNDFKSRPLSYIDLKIRHLKYSTVLSNFIQLNEMNNFKFKESKPFKIAIKNGVKIGIINIVDPALIPKDSIKNLKGIIIEDMFEAFLKYSMMVKNKGAQIVVANVHTGSSCTKEAAKSVKLPVEKVNFDPNTLYCNDNHSLVSIINKLPKKSVDIILLNSTDKEEKFNQFINNTLVLSHFSDGTYFSFAEVVFNKEDWSIQKKDSQIKGPIRTCIDFNLESNDCYTDDPVNEKVSLGPAKFLEETLPAK